MTTLQSLPQLNLPQRPPSRSKGSAAATLACVLLLAVLGIQFYQITSLRPVPVAPTLAMSGALIPAEDLKAIAMKLEDRNLAGSAAEAWRRYLDGVALEPLERARILYRVGKLGFAAEEYEAAVADLYLAERLAGDADADLTRQIALQIRECLQKMGRYSELSREMAARATPEAGTDASLAGHQLVAEIGAEKITTADFERMLAAEVEMLINAQRGLSPQQAESMREQVARQYADPQAKVQQLHQMVAARVLASEAREAGLEASPEYRQRLMAIADGLLASSFMEQEVSKRATVTPEDVKRYFEAERDQYAEPAKSTIAHIVCKSEAAAREVLRQIQEEGEDFAVMAEQESLDERTKKSGGKLAQPLTKDAESIPGIGKHPDLIAAIWAVTPPSVLADVYKSDAGWEVLKVLERTERVQKTFEEVKDQVERDAQAARQREVSQQYLRELFEKRGVKLYPEAFGMAQKK